MAAATEDKGPEILSPAAPEEEVGVELGDLVFLLGGRLNGTVGKFYGFSEDRFTIQPKGSTNTVIHIPLVDGDPDPDYALQEMKILRKAPRPGFITMVDMRAGQQAETFTDSGEPAGTFRVVSVDEENDSAVLADETGSETTIKFGFQGIPRDLPFQVIRTREPPVTAPEGSAAGIVAEPVPTGEVQEEDLSKGEGVGDDEIDTPSDFAVGEEIELPEIEEIRELASSEKIYPDVLQRSEMFAQLIRLLPEAQQKNATKLQEIRRLVEVYMIMRNKVVQYGKTGEPIGKQETSFTRLSDLIKNTELYLARKVVNMNKNLYLPHNHDSETGEVIEDRDRTPGPVYDEEGERTGLIVKFQKDILERAAELDATAEMESGERAVGQIPGFFSYLESYKRIVHMPYEAINGDKIPQRDEEVFYREIPDFDDPHVTSLTRGIVHPFTEILYTEKVPFATTRLLKPRQGRFLQGERERIVEGGDAHTYDNILLFPRTTQRDLGPIRSGYLAQDIGLSMTKPTLLKDILEEYEMDEFPDSDKILLLGLKGGILGNVELKDWLENQDLQLTGLADVYRLLHGYGVQNIEWNTSQVAAFVEKIEQHIATLRIHLGKQREENKVELENLRFEGSAVLPPENAANLQSTIEGEPILQKVLEEVKEYMGDLASIDINWFTYIFLKYPDLTLAVLGKQPELVARERLRNVREQFLQALSNAYRAKQRAAFAGEPPMENKCKHVQDLQSIRKAAQVNADEPRDVTKMRLLLKFLGKYRSKTEDNWVWCNLCDQHLICAHEHLQIQEFARPKEKEIIHKDLLLKFSGGQFGGKFICRVCGQAIQDLDFDTNLEFDDEGRPMMGRSVMVDQEQIEIDEVEGLLAGPAEKKEEVDFGTEHLNEMYRTLKTIVGLVGIAPEDEDYRKMVSQLSTYISSLPTREVYARMPAVPGKKQTDYDVFYSARYMAAGAAVVLINVQTHIPDYIIYYTNTECRNGLLGYPLEGPENTAGIQCVTSVIAGINENTFPWNRTGLQRTSDYIKRTNTILPFVQKIVEDLAKNPVIQLQLKKKREYQEKTLGYIGTKKAESIASSFRPIPYIVPVEEAAADAIVAAAATPEKKATAWIQTAHRLARDGSALNPDSPYTETTCCLHRITNPTEFWQTQQGQLPSLEPKAIGNPPYRTGTAANTLAIPEVEELVGKTNPNEYYKLFTRVCYRGVRKGMPHELGLGSKPTCMNCNLNFLQNPTLTLVPDLASPSESPADAKVRMKEQQEILQRYETELKAHIEGQGIEINEETFMDLLHTTQRNVRATADSLPSEPKKEEAFRIFASLEHQPIEEWVPRLQEIHIAFRDLGESPSTVQIATAAERLVEVIGRKEEEITRRIRPAAFKVLESIVKKSPRECGETITTYLLVPFQRWLNGRGPKSFEILKSYELSPETRTDILVRGLGSHLELLQGGEELKGVLKRKVKLFVNQLSEIARVIFPFMRQNLVPGGNVMIIYLQRALLMGYVQMLLNPNFVPEDGDVELEEDGAAVNMGLLNGALTQALTKYARGSYVPTDEEIRVTLVRRTEMENQKFIKRLDKMTLERRKVEVELKKKGMGEWAVGGTKAIRQYDADRYEAERIERAQAGLVDYVPVMGEDGRPFDMFGYVEQEGNIDDAAGDYGMAQEADDDF